MVPLIRPMQHNRDERRYPQQHHVSRCHPAFMPRMRQNENDPEKTWLPGIFVQDEMKLAEKHQLLLGFRYDYNNIHGNIFTPRFAYKWSFNENNIFRLNAGTGFRVVNLFTEDHAALTGAREVVVLNDLKPEKSYNVNFNYIKKMYFDSGGKYMKKILSIFMIILTDMQ